jgi:2-succinyl-5-enolpyruvyl-6-hydroxy-3-cyclohexene-1-carboxylate synthase
MKPADDWLGLWERAESTTRTTLDQWTAAESGSLEGEILAAVVDGLPDSAGLLVASSMPIRDLDAFVFPGSKALRVFGNRGVSGIDGLVSTTAGIAVGSVGDGAQRPKEGGGPDPGEDGTPPTVGVLGDLAFLHDLNGLQALGTSQANVVLVVVNNDGGGIFHTLPVREYEPAFTRFFATPHGLRLEKAAELHGIPYSQARSLEEFKGLFSQGMRSGGPAILEVRTDRAKAHHARRGLVDAVRAAVEGLGSE